jgi:CubicO group peptidase (beta-lactamase class C family)
MWEVRLPGTCSGGYCCETLRMTTATEVLGRFVRAVDAEGLGAYGAHVLVGQDDAQHRWRSDDRENVYSVSKGVCALAVGIAIEQGIVTLDSPVSALLVDMDLGAGVEGVTYATC